MPTIQESYNDQNPLKASLNAGINNIAQDQIITFTQYEKLIIPADGFAFWVKTSTTLQVKGSLHFSGDQQQREDETIGINHVIFTSEKLVNDFTEIAPDTLYIGEFDGFKFSFNRTKNFYKQADIWHYIGDAIYPAFESQILDSASGFDAVTPVVSNSLPLFLQLTDYCDMYPSFLVDPNIAPPFASIHVEPSQTLAMQSMPLLTNTLSHYQLATDKVRITTYGLRNDAALDFQDYILNHSINTDDFGILNMPIMRDEKRTQSELNILAQKKVLELDISYFQSRVAAVSRQLITNARVNYYPQ